LKETKEDVENSINTIFEKGTYMIKFTFKGVGASKLEIKCTFFDLYLGIIPTTLIQNYSNNVSNCETKSLDQLLTNTYSPNNLVKFTNNENTNLMMKFANSNVKRRFMAELITNPYSDSTYRMKVLRKPYEDEDSDTEYIDVETEYIQHENFLWVLFHTEASTQYYLNIKPDSIANYPHCSTVTFSFNYEDLEHDSTSPIASEDYKKDICPINKHLPNKISYKGNEFSMVDEFLLPENSTEVRSSFKVKEDKTLKETKSLVYVQVTPKYKNLNNIIIEVYRDKEMSYRYNHNEHNGILMFVLEKSDTPYYLKLIFDKTLSECETYQFSFSIVPRQTYLDEYLACDNEIDKIPEAILIDKTSEFNYLSMLGYGDKNLNGFAPDAKSKGIWSSLFHLP
jgi:hypothetical protein